MRVWFRYRTGMVQGGGKCLLAFSHADPEGSGRLRKGDGGHIVFLQPGKYLFDKELLHAVFLSPVSGKWDRLFMGRKGFILQHQWGRIF